MPLISVIIPVYNGEKTIQETVLSVLNQTFTDFELIVVNDGSQDATLAILSNIQDPRIKIVSYANAGLPVSRNRGIALATGEYLSFLDADDLWTPDKLADQLAALKNNPPAAVAYSWADCIDEQGHFLRPSAHASLKGNVLPNLLLSNFVASGSNILVHQQALADVGGFDETLSNSQDWDLYLRLATRYQFVPVCSPQVLYRVSTHSMSSTNILGMEKSVLCVVERFFAQAADSLQYLKRHSLGNCYKYLTFKVLQGQQAKQRSRLAVRYLWNAVKCDPDLLKVRVTWKALLKIVVVALLPARSAERLTQKLQRLFNLDGLLARMQIDPAKFAAYDRQPDSTATARSSLRSSI